MSKMPYRKLLLTISLLVTIIKLIIQRNVRPNYIQYDLRQLNKHLTFYTIPLLIFQPEDLFHYSLTNYYLQLNCKDKKSSCFIIPR